MPGFGIVDQGKEQVLDLKCEISNVAELRSTFKEKERKGGVKALPQKKEECCSMWLMGEIGVSL
eukprot:4340557-Prorocentrum_lima.AAC.1